MRKGSPDVTGKVVVVRQGGHGFERKGSLSVIGKVVIVRLRGNGFEPWK